MKAHDKLYIGLEDIGSGYVFNTSVLPNGYDEYIRKDALIEWLENKIKVPDVSFINGLTYLAYKDVIEHLNEM